MPFNSDHGRPKILFVTSHWPLAHAYGAQQRVLSLARILSRFGDVSFLIVPTEQEDEQTVNMTSRWFKVHGVIRPSVIAPSHCNQLSDRFRHELDPRYLATDECVVSEQDQAWLHDLVKQHDIVWVHTIRIANWFRTYRWPNSILDVDDLPSSQHWSEAQSASTLPKRLIHLRRYWIWRRRERVFKERFDVLTVCSEGDRQALGGSDQVHVIPNGAHLAESRRLPIPARRRIGLIGNCTYRPNEEGLKWFIRDVWPLVKREVKDAQLRIVGKGTEGYLTTLGPDIQGLGWMEHPGSEIDSWSAMIVPIMTGAGTRVKVAEGLARKCPVVATTLGAFGYDVQDEKEILIADRAQDFARACIRLLRTPELQRTLAEAGFNRFLANWRWDSFESTVGDVLRQCLATSPKQKSSAELAELPTP